MTDNERAVMGGNKPPAHLEYLEQVDALKEESRAWLDGGAITSQAEADGVAKLKTLATALEKEADTARKSATKPLDDAKKAIMADFKPVEEGCVAIKTAATRALTVWLNKLAAEKAEAERVERERIAAEQAALLAKQAQAMTVDDITESAAKVDELVNQQRALERSERDTVKASGVGRSVSLVTEYSIRVTDYAALAKYAWANWRGDLADWLSTKALKDVRARSGNAQIDGVEILVSKVAR